jgi:hypothetical protein
MKFFISFILFFSLVSKSYAQEKTFVGVAQYKMGMVGGADDDSTVFVFDKKRIAQVLYMPDEKNPGKRVEIRIISDFANNRQYIVNEESKSFKMANLEKSKPYDFINTDKIMLVKGSVCFHYKADSSQIDKSIMLQADCLAAPDYVNENVREFWAMGVLPVIVDNRLVMDFIVTESKAVKPRIYIANIKRLTSVDEFFDIKGYKDIAEKAISGKENGN